MDYSFLWSAEFLFPLSLLALLVPLLLGLRHRILVAMALRNALRRKRQSLMIVAGLMVGTAIVAGAQVAGDSMGYAITKASLDAFEEIDETVFLDGYNFFPEPVVGSLAQDAVLVEKTDAVGANILWDIAVVNPRSGQYEPSARAVGFDPAEDDTWGDFRYDGESFDGSQLGARDVIVNEDLREKLHVELGDTIIVNYTLPQDPLIPAIQNYSGTLDVSATGPSLPVVGTPALEPVPAEVSFTVDPSAVSINVVLAWQFTPGVQQDLDVELVSESGQVFANRNGTIQDPDFPVFLFVNGSVSNPVEPGDWTLRVHGKNAARTNFNGTIATFYAVYDLREAERRFSALQEQFPDVDVTEFGEPDRLTTEFRVVRFTEAGKGPNFQLPNKLSLFVRLDVLQDLLHREDQVNFLKVSNIGGRETGVERTDEVYPLLWERLNATKEAYPDDLSVQALRANNDKQFWLAEAERVGELFGVFLTFVGSFSIISGLLLIINIFTMLAEERKVELAIARAVGLRRGHLIQLFTYEGIFYALPAAILGVFFGLGLAQVLIWGFNTFNPGGTFPAIPFRLEPESLPFAFAVGILLTVATVFLGAQRVSRLNVVSAIRNLEPPKHIRGRLNMFSAIFLLAAGITGSVFAVAANSFAWQLIGPTLLALGIAFLFRFIGSSRRVYPVVAMVLFAYLTATLFLIDDPDTDEAEIMGPIRAVVMTLAVVVAVVYTEPFARFLGRVASYIKPLRPVALPAMSYPLHKKVRTGLTLAMFSVILLVVMLFSILGSLFEPDVEKESGGYHVEALSGLSFDTLEGRGNDPTILQDVEFYDVLPYFIRYGGDIITVNNQSTGQFGAPANVVLGVDRAFSDRNEFTLLFRDPQYPTDRAAYQAVADDPNVVIIAYQYSTDAEGRDGAFKVGDTLQIKAKGDIRNFRIIGIQEQFHLPAVFIRDDVMRSLYANTDTLVLFKLRDPTADATMAQRIESNYQDVGLDANSIRLLVLEQNEGFRQIFTLIRLFLSLGLIVGILSLGIVTARSVIERRQEIGMMRALGYLRRHIRRTFLLEMLTTVVVGILIGLIVALIVAYAIWYGQLRELRLPFIVPWAEVATISAIALVVTTLATLSPIFRAARTPPAEALRYIE